jgi:hypothetical protein
MRKIIRSLTVTAIAVVAAALLALGSTLTTAVSLTAGTALIMGGTGRPDPDDFPGYVPNVAQYYINPNTVCGGTACDLQAVYTPETAWPVYGGLSAPTWRNSILQGVGLFDAAVQEQLPGLSEDNRLVLFGYSQSGAILAYEKAILDSLTPEQKALIEIVVIGNVSRPNGGLSSRAFPFCIPIVEFPFGPPMPNNTGIATTDIAMQWDIIADAPLYITNPVAMLNALLGFWYVHGTYPDPTEADPTDTPGGYTTEQWQWMMDHPELYPELVSTQTRGDTTYITVKPTVLPLVQPLHDLGLSPVANLLEPALRVLIEQTGYDRSIPYGQYTPFRFIPLFNPITLTIDLVRAIPQGIEQMLAGLRGEPTHIVPAPPETLLGDTPVTAASTDTTVTDAPEISGDTTGAEKRSAHKDAAATEAAIPEATTPEATTPEATIPETTTPQDDVTEISDTTDEEPVTSAAQRKLHRLNQITGRAVKSLENDTADESTDTTTDTAGDKPENTGADTKAPRDRKAPKDRTSRADRSSEKSRDDAAA